MGEQWRLIPKTYGLFEASSLGRIRRAKDKFIYKLTKASLISRNGGYSHVTLYVRKRKLQSSVHKLNCKSFLRPSTRKNSSS